MSTNYYTTHDESYIGTLVVSVFDKGTTFFWARKPADIMHLCLSYPEKYVAKTLKQMPMKGYEFLALLLFEVTHHDFSQVGNKF